MSNPILEMSVIQINCSCHCEWSFVKIIHLHFLGFSLISFYRHFQFISTYHGVAVRVRLSLVGVKIIVILASRNMK